MAPRGRLLDLERHDVLFFYGDDGAYHRSDSDRVSVATYGIVFWPVLLVAAVLLHLVAPLPHAAAAVCAALYVAYCFFLPGRAGAAQASSSSSSWPSTAAAVPPAEPSRPPTTTIVQN